MPLDDDAQKLFEELGGIDTQERKRKILHTEDGLAEALSEEEKQLDGWRILLVEFASLFAGFLNSIRLSGLTSKIEEDIDALTGTLSKLSQMPNQDGEILIRYRGMAFSTDRVSQTYDYLIIFGNLRVDIQVVEAVTNRQGSTSSHLPGKVAKAFTLLSSMSISTLHLDLVAWGPEKKRSLSQSLHALPPYYMTIAKRKAVPVQEDMGNDPPPVVFDEYGKPDANLTMLAAINRINQKTIQGLIRKVNSMMDQPALEQHPNVYNALFSFKKLKKQLVKPPLEINNVRWLTANEDQLLVSKRQAQLTRIISEKYGRSPQQTAQIMQSIYGNDYGNIRASALRARLENLTDFLDEMGESNAYQSVEDEVIDNVERRLNDVPDEVLTELVIKDNAIEVQTGRGETIWKKLHAKLSDLIVFFKNRVGTKNKIKEMVLRPINFDYQDYETIARDFDLSIEDARKLLELLQSCFDETGHFLRRNFEINIPAFARYEEKIFDFLWHYLKEVRYREDRVAFLNSLQLLIAKMQRTHTALKFILKDFCHSPETVDFPDRNTLMIANILLRKYNKELQHDVELTPEEVLLVKKGLDEETVRIAAEYIDFESGKIYQKIRTIHKSLKEALEPGMTDTKPMPIGYLITLEREFYIFMSLVGSITSHKIIQNAVKEYGDPDSEIYLLKKSKRHQSALLKLLQVTMRALVRFQNRNDLALFRSIKERTQDFLAIKDKSVPEDLVTRVLGWADISITTIREGK